MSDHLFGYILDDKNMLVSRVLVCGGREYQDVDLVYTAMNSFYQVNGEFIVIHGACNVFRRPTVLRGADRWAEEWAKANELPYIGVPAKWTGLGRAAGRIRNQFMLDQFRPTSGIAFPGGEGYQTHDRDHARCWLDRMGAGK